jgi:site-specific DNA recombinase
LQEGAASSSVGMRIPAAEIEGLICRRLIELFEDPISLIEKTSAFPHAQQLIALNEASARIATELRDQTSGVVGKHINQLVLRIDIYPDGIKVLLDLQALAAMLSLQPKSEAKSLEIRISVQLKRTGMAMRLVLQTGRAAAPRVDEELISAIASARSWWHQLTDDPTLRVADIARSNQVSESWVTRILRLAFIDPTIIELIIAGKVPANFSRQALRATGSVPELWAEQRAMHRISLAS